MRRLLYDRHAGIVLPETPGSSDVSISGEGLSFYPGYGLYTVTQKQRVTRFVAHRQPDQGQATPLVVLNGESAPIHKLNAVLLKRRELKIDRATVEAYVRFFDGNVHGDEGSFKTIENVRQLEWRFLTDDVKKALTPVPRRIRLLPTTATDDMILTAFVNYGLISASAFPVTKTAMAHSTAIVLEDLASFTRMCALDMGSRRQLCTCWRMTETNAFNRWNIEGVAS